MAANLKNGIIIGAVLATAVSAAFKNDGPAPDFWTENNYPVLKTPEAEIYRADMAERFAIRNDDLQATATDLCAAHGLAQLGEVLHEQKQLHGHGVGDAEKVYLVLKAMFQCGEGIVPRI